jgi:hypothetical protein
MKDTTTVYCEVLQDTNLLCPTIPAAFRRETEHHCWGYLTNWISTYNVGYLRVSALKTIDLGDIMSPNHAPPSAWNKHLRFAENDIIFPEDFAGAHAFLACNYRKQDWLTRFNLVRSCETHIISATNVILIPAPISFKRNQEMKKPPARLLRSSFSRNVG